MKLGYARVSTQDQNLENHLEDKDFAELFNYYTKNVSPSTLNWSNTPNNTEDHSFMAGMLIDDIAKGIQDFVEANNPSIKNDPDVTIDNYKAAAWLGLEETAAYAAYLETSGETPFTLGIKRGLITMGSTNDCN